MFPLALRQRWRDLLSGFWLIPGLIFLLRPALALLCLFLDHHVLYPDTFSPVFDNPDAVHSVLTTVSEVLISIPALMFSITLVALQVISSQFTHRAFVLFLGVGIAAVLLFVGLLLLFLLTSHAVYAVQVANMAARITGQTLQALRKRLYPDILAEQDIAVDGDR